jgi:HEPN domain-containing protein
VHTLADVNRQLEQGRPFFVDIAKQGIALYEAEGFPLSAPRDLPPEDARAEALAHFDKWFQSSEEFLFHGRDAAARGWSNKAAFELHQATERLYHCALLVLTLYSPKSHKLNFLRSRAEDIAPPLIEAWPRDDKFSRRCFELLRQAYVNARYSPHYKISAEELAWLGERVSVLRDLVRIECEKRLAPRD